MKEQLLKSSFFRVIEIVVITFISLALTPYLIKHLGDENYGLWLLILSVLGWFNFIDLGFSSAVKREIAIALENLNNERINVVFSVSVVLFGSLGVIAASCILILGLFPEILGVNDSSQITASIALSILAVKVLLDFVMNSFHGFFTAYLRMDIDANISLLNTLIKSVLVYFLIIDMNIYGAVVATITADIFTHLLKIVYAKKLHSQFKFSFTLVSFDEVKYLFNYSKHLVAMGIASTIQKRSDPVVISHILGLKFVALYGVINNLINQLEALVLAIVGVFNPMLTRLVARGNNIEVVFKQVVDVNFFVVILLYAPLAIFAENFINLWIGEEYAKNASLAYILGFAYICKSISRPIASLLLAQANHKLLSIISLLGALINISLSIMLAQIWGLKGVAIATAISFFISDVVLHLVLVKQYNNIKVIPLILKFFVIMLVYIVAVEIGKYILGSRVALSWFELFISASIVTSILFIIAWFGILTLAIRKQLLSTFFNKT